VSISTYSELQTAITDFLNRDDLASVVPTFISLAEADINRRLRHYRMQVTASPSLSSQYTALPTDWLEAVRLSLTGTPLGTRVELISHADLLERKQQRAGRVGVPEYFAVTGSNLELFPVPDATYSSELLYFGRIPALSISSPSTWLLTEHPDIYLYGALTHSAPYLQDDARIQVWASLYQAAVDAANVASQSARFGGTGLRMKTRAY